MKHILIVFTLFAATAVFAQDKNPVTSVVKEILPRQQKNLVAAVEEMPADKFGFHPTPRDYSVKVATANGDATALENQNQASGPERYGRKGQARGRAQGQFRFLHDRSSQGGRLKARRRDRVVRWPQRPARFCAHRPD